MKISKIKSSDVPNLGIRSDDGIRQLRAPLMSALDIYDKNVLRGRITETPEEKVKINEWYQKLCDLDPTALDEIPAKVQKYIK